MSERTIDDMAEAIEPFLSEPHQTRDYRTKQWIEEQLREPLPKSAVIYDKNRKFDYLDWFYINNELNRIFGPGGWQQHIMENGTVGQPYQEPVVEKANSQTGEVYETGGKFLCGHRTMMKLTFSALPGHQVTDVGYGSGWGKGLHDAMESAEKASITDSIKRASRHLGCRFNALYDKSQERVTKDAKSPFAPRFSPDVVHYGPHAGKGLHLAKTETLQQYYLRLPFDCPQPHFDYVKEELQRRAQAEQEGDSTADKLRESLKEDRLALE